MRISFLFIISLTIVSMRGVKAQEPTQKQSAVLNHIAVYVTNLENSTAFYKNTFGLKQIPEPFKDGRHTWFTLGTAGNLHLIQGAKTKGDFDKNEHLCFSVASVDDFVVKLIKDNIAYENWEGAANKVTLRVDGVKQVYFRDPDGHWLEVNDDH